MELKDVKKWNRLLQVLILAGAALGFFPSVLQLLFLGIGLLAIVVRMVLLLQYWRCPHCHEPLPIRGMGKLENCPKCEKALPLGQDQQA